MATDEIVAKFISKQLRPQNLKKQGMLLSKNPTFINRPNGVTNMDFSEIIETQNMPESNVQPSLGSQVLTGLKGVASNIGKLAEKPETWRNLSNVLSVIAAPGNPQLSNVLQNISQSINTNIENKKNREFQIVDARNKSKQKDIQTINYYLQKGFTIPKENKDYDKDLMFNTELPSGQQITFFNQELAENQKKPKPGYLQVNENVKEKITEFENDPSFAISGSVDKSNDTFNPKNFKEYIQKKEEATDNLLKKEKSINQQIDNINNILKNPKLDKIIGKKNFFGLVNISKEWLSTILGASEGVETILASLQSVDADKTLTKLNELKESGRGSTGFGALNMEELKVIRNALVSLNKAQSKEGFKKSLDIIKDTYRKSLKRETEKYEGKYKLQRQTDQFKIKREN
jgi:hypothetical protein